MIVLPDECFAVVHASDVRVLTIGQDRISCLPAAPIFGMYGYLAEHIMLTN